jgi:hypothetical protein
VFGDDLCYHASSDELESWLEKTHSILPKVLTSSQLTKSNMPRSLPVAELSWRSPLPSDIVSRKDDHHVVLVNTNGILLITILQHVLVY